MKSLSELEKHGVEVRYDTRNVALVKLKDYKNLVEQLAAVEKELQEYKEALGIADEIASYLEKGHVLSMELSMNLFKYISARKELDRKGE